MTAATAEPTERRTHPAVTAFRVTAIAEAISWAGLLIAMLFKYVIVKTATGVEIMGPIHGVIFLAYVVSTLVVASQLGWKLKTTLLGLFSAIPPFVTVVFEMWAHRSGHLDPRAGRTAAPTS